jgi:hypothetical protein
MDSAYRARASEVHLVEQAMVAAIGAGLPITEPSGNWNATNAWAPPPAAEVDCLKMMKKRASARRVRSLARQGFSKNRGCSARLHAPPKPLYVTDFK